MSSIPTPASVVNSHSDFLNTHQSLTATILGILVSFSEGWLVFQVVLYHQPAVPYQPNTPPKMLKPNSSMTQIIFATYPPLCLARPLPFIHDDII